MQKVGSRKQRISAPIFPVSTGCDKVTEDSTENGYNKENNRRDKHCGMEVQKDLGLFDFWKMPDINQGVEECRKAGNAVLLDVRTPEEYREGHIPGSKNVPLQILAEAGKVIGDKAAPVFVYCHSGGRSHQAVEFLRKMGYTNVKNIGGIAAYRGKVEC